MEAYTIKNLTFCYPETEVDALKNISFSINCGEFITLCGPSGCGKSTLLRQLKPDLAPHGSIEGNILFENEDIHKLSHRVQSQKIGFVMQSLDNQIVTDKVWHELVFGLESLGYDNSTIRKRVAETANFFGIHNWFDKNISELSGGQKQILNLASIMAMQPSVLLLDEPTSQLDPIAAANFLSCISKINRELGVTVIITEHRLDEVLPLSNRVLVLENGELISFETPKSTGNVLKSRNSKTLLSMPAPMRIWMSVENSEDECPVTVTEGKNWLEKYSAENELNKVYPETIPECSEDVDIELNDVWFRYNKDSPDVIKGLSIKIHKGEFVAVLGGNGTGKSTMLSIINGTNKPYRGKTRILSHNHNDNSNNAQIATLPQNPKMLFLKKTVLEDLLEIFDNIKIDKTLIQNRINSVISLCKLEQLIDRHTYDLSGGEQQRAALAKILLLKPRILLLDEPTKGLDAEFKLEFAKIINTLTHSGVTVLMVSHDIEFCAKYPHKCMMFFNGEVTSQGSPRKFFASNSFYSTSANRMSRSIIKNAVTVEDVIYCCTGNKDNDTDYNTKTELYEYEQNSNSIHKNTHKNLRMPMWKKFLGVFSFILLTAGILINSDCIPGLTSKNFSQWFDYLIIGVPVLLLMISFGSKSKKPVAEIRKNHKLPKRTIAMTVISLITIPVTIFIGITYLQDQKYLFISLLVLIESMIPFFMFFEGRQPKARELVIIAVLCALSVSSRLIFNMLPQFKPIIAIIIISGVAFGGESGFLVGSVTMLVSNIIFGQGSWTPWQMFAAGIIGFFAGVLFKKGLLGRNRASLCIFGFMAVLILYGGIMNFYSAVSSHSVITSNMILSFYIQGLPMDIVHAVSTVIFLYFAAEPVLEKLDRIKIKYGLIT